MQHILHPSEGYTLLHTLIDLCSMGIMSLTQTSVHESTNGKVYMVKDMFVILELKTAILGYLPQACTSVYCMHGSSDNVGLKISSGCYWHCMCYS